MERLTENVLGNIQLKACGNDFCKETCAEHDEEKSCDNCPIQKAFEKLAEYEDLEDQNKLLKLPCAVGDTVYLVSFRKKCYKMGNTHLVNDDLECAFCESECVCKAKKEYFIEEIKATLPIIGNLIDRPDDFMVFLTRPEAERALAEMEGENDNRTRENI